MRINTTLPLPMLELLCDVNYEKRFSLKFSHLITAGGGLLAAFVVKVGENLVEQVHRLLLLFVMFVLLHSVV